MDNRLRRFQKARTLVLGAATLTLFWVAGPVQAQSTTTQDRQAAPGDRRDIDRRDVANFDRFLDQHREIAEQVRKDPSLLDNRKFVESHPALQTYLRDNPGVRDQLRQDANAFMQLADRDNREANQNDRDAGTPDRDPNRTSAANERPDADRRNQDQDRDADHRGSVNRDAMNFDRFLDDHREIGEQVRKDPSLLDNQTFVASHPALQTYLQDNPGVQNQIKQNPNAFMQLADRDNRESNMHDRDPMHNHMADFGGFLGSHSDLQRDLSRNPSIVKDHQYVQDHPELNTYLNAHPDVRDELMANPQDFVHGAEQLSSTPTTGSSTNPSATAHVPKPNQPKQ